MAKPSSVVTWASDNLVSAGPEIGLPTKVDPVGAVAQGAVAGRAAPARWYNFILNHFSLWAAYLDNLHNESAFLGASYTWTNYHQFDSAPTFVAGAQFQGPVAFLDDVTFDGPVSLFDGTFVDGFIGMTGEVVYSTGFGDPPTPLPRTVVLPLALGTVSANVTGNIDAFFTNTTGFWQFRATGQVTFPLSLISLPRGATLVNVKIGVSNSSGGTLNASCLLFAKAPNIATPSTSFAATISTGGGSTAISAGTDHVFTLTSNIGTFVMDNSINELHLTVDSGDGMRIHWIQVNYLDPGPRNG